MKIRTKGIKKTHRGQPTSLFSLLVCLTGLFVFAQLAFFYAHYKVSDLIDSIAQSSIARDLFHPVILFPLLKFAAIQILAYLIFIAFIWFISVSMGELFKLSKRVTNWVGIGCWSVAVLTLLSLNDYYFPASFFARPYRPYELAVLAVLLSGAVIAAYVNMFRTRRHRLLGGFFLLIVTGTIIAGFYEPLPKSFSSHIHDKPNIILIGLDSLRPDFTGYHGMKADTPHIDQFLQSALTFTQAYTPLARTFPAWVSILTAQYPRHNQARMNLVDPSPILANEMLGKKLQAQGYFTIYGTDETRFTDINQTYGFDRLIGPRGGAVEFLLGGLSDFPLANLLVNLPFGRYLFPYHYGNRAAEITYQPQAFLQLVKAGLVSRPDKPVFLALHLCLSHWPFTWAQDGQAAGSTLAQRYQKSVQAVDVQLGKLLALLKKDGLLENSLVVLLSDHGVTVGLPDDRATTKDNYRGHPSGLTVLPSYPISSAENQYSLSTSYGQGTDVLSLKQYQVVLGFKGFGLDIPARKIDAFVSLLDIAPTVLDFLRLAPFKKADGISLWAYFSGKTDKKLPAAPFFIETADTIADMEADKIFVEKVVRQTIGAYQVNLTNGQLELNPQALPSIIKNKQRAVLWGEWMLARYPAQMRMKLAPLEGNKKNQYRLKPYLAPAYFVLLNRKTGLWTLELGSSFAKTAPVKELMGQLQAFYGEE